MADADVERSALEKEWLANDGWPDYPDWLEHELLKARAAQPSSSDLEKLARRLALEDHTWMDKNAGERHFLQLLTSTLGTK